MKRKHLLAIKDNIFQHIIILPHMRIIFTKRMYRDTIIAHQKRKTLWEYLF